jgi:superfamily II DNA or RNA helicase
VLIDAYPLSLVQTDLMEPELASLVAQSLRDERRLVISLLGSGETLTLLVLMGVLECGGDIISMVCGVLVLLLMGEG